MKVTATLKMAAIGIDHGHIYGMVRGMSSVGAQLVAWGTGPETPDADKKRFTDTFPDAPFLPQDQILQDESISLVLVSAVNSDRAEVALAAMRHGKDVLVDKPGCTDMDQLSELRRVASETGRKWLVYFSERLAVESATLAGKLIEEGRIGKVVQTVGFGPHSMRPDLRPDWFWSREKTGGILTDICAHQFDQFLHFTGSTSATVVTAFAGNTATPDRPAFQDFGEVLLQGDGGRGYARVDWLTPKGLPVWGDGRMTILGTDGYIELRKYIDIAGRPGGDHVFVVDGKDMTHLNAEGSGKPFYAALLADIRDRSETAMTQAHAFLATGLALKAQVMAERPLA